MKLSFTLSKTPEFVYDYLTDMEKFASVHPVISKIEKIKEATYTVHEKLYFMGIPFSFTYPVTISSNGSCEQVVFEAKVFKIVTIKMVFNILGQGDLTLVKETIVFSSYLPIKAILRRVFRKHHVQLFKNIDLL